MVVLGLVLALWDLFDDVQALDSLPMRIFWAVFMLGIAGEWFCLRQRDQTGIADRLGISIGVLLWALGWALAGG
jgi:hypothetical protein